MPPEQAEGKVAELDARSDIYSLGAILYQILTGEPPYTGSHPFQVMKQVFEGTLVPPRERAQARRVPWELEAAALRAMARDPAERYPDVASLKRDLEAYLGGEVLAAARYTALQRLAKWVRRHRIGVAAGSVVLAAVTISFWRISRSLAAERTARAEERAQREQAASERDKARDEYRKFLRMSDLARVARLVGEAEELWPAHQRMIPHYRAWLVEAEKLAARLAEHRASLAALAKLPEPDVGQQWIKDNLARLVRDLEVFTAPDPAKGLTADVRARLEAATTSWGRTVERHRDRWDAACRAIREHPAYGKLDLAPQEGLVPIGPDPDSKLWEFAHLGSGAIPARDARGKLLFKEESAIVLVLLPGGAFSMGASRTEGANLDPAADSDEGPVHRVALAPFFIGKHEVTQAQWQRLVGTNPSTYTAKSHPGWFTPLHPVEMVSWEDADRATRRAGLALPTETQWECAARAGTASVWWTGSEVRSLSGAANVADRSYRTRLRGATFGEEWDDGYPIHSPVGRFKANAFGIHDVAGNVWEWCADPYHERAYRLPLLPDGSGARRYPDEWLREGVRHRANRGGSWVSPAVYARSAARNRLAPGTRGLTLGLRAARGLSRAP